MKTNVDIENDVDNLFKTYDKNKSGAIDTKELKKLIEKEYGEKLTLKETKEQLKEVDTNGNGKIGKSEAIAFFKAMRKEA